MYACLYRKWDYSCYLKKVDYNNGPRAIAALTCLEVCLGGEMFFFFYFVDRSFVLAEFDIKSCLPLSTLSLECAGGESQSVKTGSHIIKVDVDINSTLFRNKQKK